jgi:hypothetical protein
MDLGASDQEYARAGASRWRAPVIFEQLVHMAHEEPPDSVTCVSSYCDQRVRSVRNVSSGGVIALLALGAINRSGGRPWASC